jgi:hypothetical protein
MQIGEVLPLLEQYKALFNHRVEFREVLALMYEDILEFHKGALRYFSGRSMFFI